jgi:hypothetical protein
MPKFILAYTATARCAKHNHRHEESRSRSIDAQGIGAALAAFDAAWQADDYVFFRTLQPCPTCEMITDTSYAFTAIEIIETEPQGIVLQTAGGADAPGEEARQNRSLSDAFGMALHGEYTGYAIHQLLAAKGVREQHEFRKRHNRDFVAATLKLCNNDKDAAKSMLEASVAVAKRIIRFTDPSDYAAAKSVSSSVKNFQNRSYCEALGVPYDKILAAKAVVAVISEHGQEPRVFRAANKTDFAGAMLAFFQGDVAKARQSLKKQIEAAKRAS